MSWKIDGRTEANHPKWWQNLYVLYTLVSTCSRPGFGASAIRPHLSIERFIHVVFSEFFYISHKIPLKLMELISCTFFHLRIPFFLRTDCCQPMAIRVLGFAQGVRDQANPDSGTHRQSDMVPITQLDRNPRKRSNLKDCPFSDMVLSSWTCFQPLILRINWPDVA